MSDKTTPKPRTDTELPSQIIIRDSDIIRDIERARVESGDTSCAATMRKILVKYFAQKEVVAGIGG